MLYVCLCVCVCVCFIVWLVLIFIERQLTLFSFFCASKLSAFPFVWQPFTLLACMCAKFLRKISSLWVWLHVCGRMEIDLFSTTCKVLQVVCQQPPFARLAFFGKLVFNFTSSKSDHTLWPNIHVQCSLTLTITYAHTHREREREKETQYLVTHGIDYKKIHAMLSHGMVYHGKAYQQPSFFPIQNVLYLIIWLKVAHHSHTIKCDE